MLKYNLYQILRIIAFAFFSIMPYFWLTPSVAQAQLSASANERYASEVFQYLAAEVALQRGDVALAYQTMLNLAKNTRNPLIAQHAMEIALAAQSGEASLEAARLWDELTPDSDTNSKEVYLTLLMFNNKWNEAVEPTIKYLKSQTPAKREAFLTQLLPILNKSNNQDLSNVAFAKIINALKPLPQNLNVLFIYALGEEKLGNFANMEKVLRSIIKQKPNDASALNALGYSFADRNINLPESLRLIQQANSITPNDPYIIDSLGWVYYRLGNLDLAIKYLTQSFNQLAEAEVGAHLGEVLWVTGQTEEAEKIWRKAEAINASHATLRETIKRLRPDWSSSEIFDESIARQWDGRFAVNIRSNQTKNGGTGAFSLSYENLIDNLEIRSPLGTSIAKINVTPSKATLEQNGRITTSVDADQLVLQATQLPIPARGLSAWLSGFARPGSPGSVKRNDLGQVSEIIQDGWLLKYTWDTNNKLLRLNMTRSGQEGDVEVRLIID
jgi:outer membrane biogenesis lipoprotein LolB